MNKKIFFCAVFLFSISKVEGQAVGSVSTYGGSLSTKSIASGGSSVDVSETLYIGPGTHVIDGTWEIYARQVLIDPAAVISGNGVIDYYNPSAAGGIASATLIDGNASLNALDVDIQLQNASGMQLAEMTFPVSHISDGWVNNSSASSLYVGRNLFMTVDGADITLGVGVQGDLRFDDNASIFNYRPERMIIVNNSILSHVVKENYTSAFVFPVGIADGDYTPAQIGNTSNVTVNVSVQDYIASASDEVTVDPSPGGFLADGMRRTWHIFGSVAGTGSTINLQHNLTTNQSGFTDASHFVTQWSATVPNTTGDNIVPFSSSAWQSNTLGSGVVGTLITPAGSLGGTSMRSRAYSALATSGSSEESYFTKSADATHPLPLSFLSNTAVAKQCDVAVKWSINKEETVEGYNIKHSTDGRIYQTIARVQASNEANNYSYIHTDAPQGDNFYFIEAIYVDGTSLRSSTMRSSVACAPSVKIYPNPSQGFIVIENLSKEASWASIYSLDGKLVLHKQIGNQTSQFKLDVLELPIGNYLLKIISEAEVLESMQITKE